MTILTKDLQRRFDKLCTVFPLLKNINTEMVDLNDSFVESLSTAHQAFFTEVNYPQERNGLNNKLQAELAKPEFKGLKTEIKYFVKKYFNPRPATDSLEIIIPDILLILLAKYPIKNNKQTILDLICGACEAQNFKKSSDNAKHKELLYLIEWQAPGLLSRVPKLDTNVLMDIQAEITIAQSAHPQFSPADVELAVGRKLNFLEGGTIAKRGALHPASRFLAQHPIFTHRFAALTGLNWPVRKLEEFNKAYQNFFQYHLEKFPTDINASPVLRIIDRYKLTLKTVGYQNLDQLKEQCKKIISVNELIKDIEIKHPTGTPDDIWEKRKLTCYHNYFMLLLLSKNPAENLAPKKTIENIDDFELFLTQKGALGNNLQITRRVLGQLFPNLIDKLSDEKITILKKVQEKLLRPISEQKELAALASANKIDFDEVIRIILDNDLLSLLQVSTSNTDIIRQCRNILRIAAQVNNDARSDKHKPVMMQLAMQFPDAYKYFKVNTDNLAKAVDVLKNRAGKSNEVVINELRCIGDKNEKKRALLAMGITQVRQTQADAVYAICQVRKDCFKPNQKYTAQEVLQANQDSRDNKNLFEFFLNSTVNENDPELVRCMAQLPFAKNGEAVLAYYKAQGNTASFQYLSLAAAVIAREGHLLDEAELTVLSNFLVEQMTKNDLTLNTDEPILTDLCDYYNNKNAQPIGKALIDARDAAKAQTYAQVEALFKKFPLQDCKDEIIAIYAYYLGYKKSTDFIYKAMEENIKKTADVPVFYHQLEHAHFAVMACKNKSLLKLEFQFPDASRFAAQIKNLKKNRSKTFNYNERIIYAIEVAKLGFDDPKDMFLFAFNYPDIAKQCTDQETYIGIASLGQQPHDILQLRLFLRELETKDPDLDYSDALDNLMGKSTSTRTPLLSSSSSSSNAPGSGLGDAKIKEYVTAFYLIAHSYHTPENKLLLQKKLAEFLQSNASFNPNLSHIKELETQLGIDLPSVVNLEDKWNLISDEEAKLYAEIFNQKITQRSDLIYAFNCFSNYPARTATQEILFNTLKNYISGGSSRAAYLQIAINYKLYKETKYKTELEALNKENILNLEIKERVNSKPEQDQLLAFFKKYNVIQTAAANPGDWIIMLKEVSEFIGNKKVNVQDVEIMVEIALRYPDLLKQLPEHVQGYKNLNRDFEFITDERIKRQLIIKLCNDPDYKKTLLKELTLNRKFTSKPHNADENKMRDELLAIHLEYGEGLSAHFRRFKDDKLHYVSAYMSVCEVATETQKYCESNSSADKNESFLIHLHWLAFKSHRSHELSAEFIKKHQEFTVEAQKNDFVKTMSLDMQIPLRNKLVELERVKGFFDDAQKNPISAYKNYSFLYELVYKRKRTDLKNEINFSQHPVFMVFSLIRDNGFLSLREKENLYNTVFIHSDKFTPEFLKLTELLGIYPVLLLVQKNSLIKKYAKELNRKIQLSNPEKLAGLPIKLDELLKVVDDKTTLATLQKIIKSKEFASALTLSVIDDAHKEYEKFIMRIFPDGLHNETLEMRLQRLELASSGILEDIYEENGEHIDDILHSVNDYHQKIAWLTQLIDSIEEIINLNDQQTLATANDYYADEIKTVVAAISTDSEFLNQARVALGLNGLTKDQLKDIETLLPNLFACYAQYKDMIYFYIMTHKRELLENPSNAYSHILSVAKLLEQYNINPKEYNSALMEIVFSYPLFVYTMNNPAYVKSINYAILEHYETNLNVLLCIQYFESKSDIKSFIDYIKTADASNKIEIKLENLTHYLGTIRRNTLSTDEKNVLSLELIDSFKKNHAPFEKFDDSMSHIGELAGYPYQISAILPSNDLYLDSLSQRLDGMTSTATHKGLSFDAVLSCHSAEKTNKQLTISAQRLNAKNTYEANVGLAVQVISNMVHINAGTLFAHTNVVANEHFSLTNEKNLTVEITKDETFGIHHAQISGPAATPVQILALLTIYDEFIQNEIKVKAGVNFLHLGSIAADYQLTGLSRKMDKYYHLTNWQQQNMAAATYAVLAHDSSNFHDIYQGRENDTNMKFNAACQLYETGLALYLLETPISTYALHNNQLVLQINFSSNMHDPQQLQSILKQLSKFNDLKQFNRGICSQRNLGLIAELFDCHYEVGKDNIATLLYKYRLGEIKTPFADQLYAQFNFFLRGVIDEAQFFEALGKCADLPANDPIAQRKLLKHYAALTPKPSNTAHTTITTTVTVDVPKTTTFSSLAPAFIKK